MPPFTRTSLTSAMLCATLSLGLAGASLVCAPQPAQAQEPSALDQREYDEEFEKLEYELNQQITRKNTIYEATIKRHRGRLEPILKRMERGGVDTSGRRAAIDTLIEDAYARLAVAQTKKLHGSIKKNVPKVVAEPGVDTIAPTAPTWCAKIDEVRKKPSGASSISIPSSAESVTLFSIREALTFSCGAKDFPLTQKWTAAYRQTLSNLLGLSAEENLELVTYAASTYRKLEYSESVKLREHPTVNACAAFGAPESALVEDQMTRYLERNLFRCKKNVTTIPSSQRLPFDGQDAYWLVDLEGYPSTHIARLGLARRLLSKDLFAKDLANPIKSRDPFRLVNNFALAGALPITRDGVLSELASTINDDEALWAAKIHALAAWRDLERARGYVLRLAEKNPGFKQIFIDAPAKGYAGFAKDAKPGQDELELILALEDKLLRKESIDGCGEAVYDKLTPWIKKQHKANKFKHYEDVSFGDYEGSLILQGLIMCGASDTANVPALARIFEDLYYQKTESQRGPLSAAYKAMFDAYNDYRQDPPKAKKSSFSRKRGGASDGFVQLDIPGVYPNPIRRPRVPVYSAQFRYEKLNNGLAMKLMKGRRPTTFHAKQAVIKKIAKSGGGRVTVTFRTDKYKSPIRDCKETGRIDRIDDQGRFVPEYRCKTVGYESVKVDSDPIEVPEWAAKDLKKGQLLIYFSTSPVAHKNQPSYGWPLASFKSKKGKKLVGLYGVKL